MDLDNAYWPALFVVLGILLLFVAVVGYCGVKIADSISEFFDRVQ